MPSEIYHSLVATAAQLNIDALSSRATNKRTLELHINGLPEAESLVELRLSVDGVGGLCFVHDVVVGDVTSTVTCHTPFDLVDDREIIVQSFVLATPFHRAVVPIECNPPTGCTYEVKLVVGDVPAVPVGVGPALPTIGVAHTSFAVSGVNFPWATEVKVEITSGSTATSRRTAALVAAVNSASLLIVRTHNRMTINLVKLQEPLYNGDKVKVTVTWTNSDGPTALQSDSLTLEVSCSLFHAWMGLGLGSPHINILSL
jgi:hypothetical protein